MQLQKSAQAVLLNLKKIHEYPPSLNVSAVPEILDSENIGLSFDESSNVRRNGDFTADNIDWDISVDSSQIDWDIGAVEETDDGGNGLGPYEIVNASDIIENSSQNEAIGSDQTPLNKREGNLHPEISVSEISWDISVETPQVDVIDDVNLPNISLENQTHVADPPSQNPGVKEGRSQLLETEYRNNLLDDLYEV